MYEIFFNLKTTDLRASLIETAGTRSTTSNTSIKGITDVFA